MILGEKKTLVVNTFIIKIIVANSIDSMIAHLKQIAFIIRVYIKFQEMQLFSI